MADIVGWMAFQFNVGSTTENAISGDGSTQGWYNTGRSFTDKTIHYGTGKAIPSTAWSQVREFNYGVDREYGGINSSGGPQQSGRPDQRLIGIEREMDQVTPHLFKHCCNGYQIRRLVFIDTTESLGDIIVVAENCNVVSFGSSESRYFEDIKYYNLQVNGKSPNMTISGVGANESTFNSVVRIDTLSILYSQLSIKFAGSSWQGWDTLQEKAWNTPGYTVDATLQPVSHP